MWNKLYLIYIRYFKYNPLTAYIYIAVLLAIQIALVILGVVYSIDSYKVELTNQIYRDNVATGCQIYQHYLPQK